MSSTCMVCTCTASENRLFHDVDLRMHQCPCRAIYMAEVTSKDGQESTGTSQTQETLKVQIWEV